MGAVRSLLRKYFTPTTCCRISRRNPFTPTLSAFGSRITGITIVFYAVVSFAIIATLRPSADLKGHAHEGSRSGWGWAGRSPYWKGDKRGHSVGNIIKKLGGEPSSGRNPVRRQQCAGLSVCLQALFFGYHARCRCLYDSDFRPCSHLVGVKAVGRCSCFYAILCRLYRRRPRSRSMILREEGQD